MFHEKLFILKINFNDVLLKTTDYEIIGKG